MTSHVNKFASKHAGLILMSVSAAAFICLAVLMSMAGSGQANSAPVQTDLQSVEVMPVSLQSQYLQQHSAVGRIESQQQAVIGFELAGTLARLLVDEGEAVEAGQLLAELDTARIQAQLQETDAAVLRARADARLALLSEQRIAALVKDGLESQQRLDEARESTAAAQAFVSETLARQQRIKVMLEQSSLIAPFDGMVLARFTDKGAVVNPGQAVFELTANQQLEARIALSADDAFDLNVSQRYQLQHGNGQLEARLKSVAKRRRLDTRTIDAMFALEAKTEEVLPGDLVVLKFDRTVAESGSWVPNQALTNGARGLWNVFTVVGEQQQRIQLRSVQVLYTDGVQSYVSGALQQGDLLVINGTQRLVPEQLVNARVTTKSDVVRK
ncbi:efflux RND transporter periplasmic adaptor subunit [Aestuariibacter salexigens]|uniref:efflux RND transporter periplasmic adaptor subunit n=1 Tax=Aestuariibacter salexigens TaxID=226010 RepID=UPI0003FFB929|nr:efflux RND transporter periplasmic adaptor subunit [Aestuariibacter salexigens]